MENIQWDLADRYRGRWIKVKFYEKEPSFSDVKKVRRMRFCEATNAAVTDPILLKEKSLSCPQARYVFGYNTIVDQDCYQKRSVKSKILKGLMAEIPVMKPSFAAIGLNTPGEPDLVLAYLPPEEVMHIIRRYNDHTGKSLQVSLSGMMPICGQVAVGAFRDQKIHFSFGCDDSRRYGHLQREHLAVGIPKNLFPVFVD
jgi:uncharacterized protein (DUF169 family)